VTDGQGGAIVVWKEYRDGDPYLDDIGDVYAQRILPDGTRAPGWPTGGLPLCTAPGAQQALVAVPDGYGGALVAWEDYRSQVSSPNTASDIYLQRVTGEAALPCAPFVPGETYGYRLRFLDEGAEQFSEETWVEVPGLTLSLAGFRPHPTRGTGVISFSLPSSEPADLQVVDPRGRIVWAREVESLGPGSHALEIGAETRLRPGAYWIRLRRGTENLTARGVALP
jgi:hypothetical protein